MHSAEKVKFAVLRDAKRVWCVAAIHGEASRLKRVHEQLWTRFRPGDRLVYLGNHLGYGPEISETLDELLAFRLKVLASPGAMKCDVVYLRGSQEEMWQKLLQLHLAINPSQVLEWILERGARATLEAYGGDEAMALSRARGGAMMLARWTNEMREAMQARSGHVALMTALQRAAFTEDGRLLFVHAGIDPSRPLEAQTDALWWDGGDFANLSEPYGGYELIVRGFDWKHGGVNLGPLTATIDGGSGFGGKLNAACFDIDGTLLEMLEG